MFALPNTVIHSAAAWQISGTYSATRLLIRPASSLSRRPCQTALGAAGSQMSVSWEDCMATALAEALGVESGERFKVEGVRTKSTFPMKTSVIYGGTGVSSCNKRSVLDDLVPKADRFSKRQDTSKDRMKSEASYVYSTLFRNKKLVLFD